MDNANFERDQKNLFKKVETGTKHIGRDGEICYILGRDTGKRLQDTRNAIDEKCERAMKRYNY